MFKLIRNVKLYSPGYLGKKDILIFGEKIVKIEDNLVRYESDSIVFDYMGKIATPGFIDQHIHVTGAGGKQGFSSMTPEITLTELISCGTTTVVGLMGTDGIARNIKSLYAKVKSLEDSGISAYMLCGYYGMDSPTITGDVQGDLAFIDKIIGCKIAISDIRSSYPNALDLARKARQVLVGGFLGKKKGVLHIHLGNLKSKMDVLFQLVKEYEFPIEHISPTHVGRTKELFDQSIEFAKLGGMIDITTGASKYTDPYKSVLYAIDKGVSIDNITFSSDGNAGLTKFDDSGAPIGVRKAPINENLNQVLLLIRKGKINIENALKLITTNPAKNMGLTQKGAITVGSDADLCFFDENFNLFDVFARGKQMMSDGKILAKDNFEN